MKTCTYLDMVRDALSLTSDNALAKKLGISRQAISNYRNGRSALEDEIAIRVADILDLPRGQVLIDMHIERTKDADTRSAWEEIAEGFPAPLPHANRYAGSALHR